MYQTELLSDAALEPMRAGMAQIVVAQAFGVEIGEIKACSRGGSRIAQARQIAMYLTHVVFEMSVNDVARGFGRHRSTALHAIQRVEALRADPELNRRLGWMESTLRGAVRDAS